MKKLFILFLLIGLFSCEMHYRIENIHPELTGMWSSELDFYYIGSYISSHTGHSYHFDDNTNVVQQWDSYTNILDMTDYYIDYYTYEIIDDYIYLYECGGSWGEYYGTVEPLILRYSYHGNYIMIDGTRYEKFVDTY